MAILPVNGVYINDNVVLVNGKFIIRDLPVGRTWVRYTVKDQCNNYTYCFTEVDVVDNVPPVAVCDEFTVVTLTTGGVAQILLKHLMMVHTTIVQMYHLMHAE